MPDLDVTIASGQAGHITDHETIHAFKNDRETDFNSIRYVSTSGNDTNDGLTWQSAFATVKKAASDVGPASKVLVGAGTFLEDPNIVWHQGQIIQGAGSSATDIRLNTGNDGSPLFVSDPNLPITEFLHWAGIRDMKIRANGNIGSDLVLWNCRIGENNVVQDVILHPGQDASGLHATHGGQPVFWKDIHSFSGSTNCQAIWLNRGGSDLFNAVTLNNISGDNHGNALIRLTGFVNANIENVTINGLKVESGLGQPYGVWLENFWGTLTIIGASHIDLGTGTGLVKIDNGGNNNAGVTLINCVGSMDFWIDDVSTGGLQIDRQHTGVEGIVFLVYRDGQILFRINDSASVRALPQMRALVLTESITAPDQSLVDGAVLFVDTADGDLKVRFDDNSTVTIGVHP